MKTHIDAVMKGVRLDCNGEEMRPIAWDVVNEAIGNNGGFGLKDSYPWYPNLPNYVDLAF